MDFDNLESLISRARLSTYLVRSGGDEALALELYKANARISSQLWVPIAHIEIAFRNRMMASLVNSFGEGWFCDPAFPPRIRSEVARQLRISDIESIHRDELARRVASQLNLGFWCQLLDGSFEKEIWVKALHKGFAPKVSRKDLLSKINEMRVVRNRIAHHEHLLNLDIKRFFELLAVLAEQIETGYSNFVLGQPTKPEA